MYSTTTERSSFRAHLLVGARPIRRQRVPWLSVHSPKDAVPRRFASLASGRFFSFSVLFGRKVGVWSYSLPSQGRPGICSGQSQDRRSLCCTLAGLPLLNSSPTDPVNRSNLPPPPPQIWLLNLCVPTASTACTLVLLCAMWFESWCKNNQIIW